MNDDAVCQVAPEWWGSGKAEDLDIVRAQMGCRVCPVTDCLSQFAALVGHVDRPDDVAGVVVAGLTGRKLFEAVKGLTSRKVHVPTCGTDAAYAAHRRRGEAPCRGCRQAHAEAEARRQVRRAA